MSNFLGLMWFDNDPKKTLELKVAQAARRYFEKFGKLPITCLVHPSMLDAEEMFVQMIVVKPSKSVLPNNLWIGE